MSCSQKPQPSDGGVYKCNIKNEFGELNANLNLNIEGKLPICKVNLHQSVKLSI